MSTDAYLDAKAEFEQAWQEVEALVGTISAVTSALRNRPDRFSFSNTVGGFPPEVVMSGDSVAADANQWPSAAQVNEALSKWHKARLNMENAWRRVPPDRQAGLVPPPGARR